MLEDSQSLRSYETLEAPSLASETHSRYDFETVRRNVDAPSLYEMFPDIINPYFSILDAWPSFSHQRDQSPRVDILHQCLSIVLQEKRKEDREYALDLICVAACENGISNDPLFKHVAKTRLHLIYIHQLPLPVGFKEKSLRHLMMSAPDCDPTDPYLRPLRAGFPATPLQPFPTYPRP